MAETLDCRAVAARYFEWIKKAKEELSRKPALATVLYTPAKNPASVQYRDLILKDAARLGIAAKSFEAGTEEELLKLIDKLNKNSKIHGVMVFYPLHAGLSDEDVMDRVSARKDIEGLHSLNLGYLIKYKQFLDPTRGVKCVVPATAKAVVKTLQSYPDLRLERAFVVIINNSMRVGKPLGLMLENLGATVVKCYDKTRVEIMEELVRRADVVITAVPDPNFALDPSWIKPGASVIDVSYQGNVDVKGLKEASYVTSADNRVGQVTRAMMFVNLIYCARNVRAKNLPVV
jgi:5,10-methylene-tetrahydrofolate dehydrogenase/methenyl tetrahydrofolate cyclohydrolase